MILEKLLTVFRDNIVHFLTYPQTSDGRVPTGHGTNLVSFPYTKHKKTSKAISLGGASLLDNL